MLAAATITTHLKPIIILFPADKGQTPGLIEFGISKLVLSGGFDFRASASFKSLDAAPSKMGGSIKPSVSWVGSGDDEGGVRAFEQEASIDGSSGFPASIATDGLEATLNNLSKWLVASVFGIVILWRHDAVALWAAMGSVLNSGLSTALKHILKQERPVSALRSDPGMPSSHAQSIFFASMFVVILVVQWLGVNPLTTTLSGLILLLGSYISWLRVSQQLHTISQVVVGAGLGSIFSLLWFWSWNAFVLTAFVSHLWVRVVVVLGAAGFCLGLLLYVIR